MITQIKEGAATQLPASNANRGSEETSVLICLHLIKAMPRKVVSVTVTQTHVKVLEDRCQRNPVASIMLLSDGQDTYSLSSRRSVLFHSDERSGTPVKVYYNFYFFNFIIMTSCGHVSTQIQIPNPNVDISFYPPISC